MEGQDEYKAGHTGSALDRAVQWALAYITTNPLNMQTKLESIEQGAQKNPSYLKDGRYILDMSTAYCAPASDGLYFSGEAVNGSYSGFSIKMPLASKTAAGVMSKEDKKKLDGIVPATPEVDGLMTAADKAKLDALKEAVELPTTSGINFYKSPFYTLGGELVNNVANYKKEEIIRPGQLSVSHYIVAYFGGVYYRYVRGLADTFGYKYSLKDTYTDADVISEISSLFHASTTQSGLMSADDKVLLNEHSILLNDFKIRTFSMEVDVDGNEIRGYEGTIGTFHVKKDEIFKVKDLAEEPKKLSGTITSSDGFNMTFNSLNPAVADKDYYGTFTIKLYGKYKVAVSLV